MPATVAAAQWLGCRSRAGCAHGAALARIELQTALELLTARFPTLRLAVPPDRLDVRRDVLTGGLTALPVTW